MNPSPAIHRKLPLFVALSILGHILLFYPFCLFHTYNFSPPVMPVLTVDLKNLAATPQPSAQAKAALSPPPRPVKPAPAVPAAAVTTVAPHDDTKAAHKNDPGDMGSKASAPAVTGTTAPERAVEKNPAPAPHSRENAVQPPLIPPGSVVSAKREKLTYSVTTHGLPVGRADIEAVNEKGELRITMSASGAGSALYVDTRLINGTNVITKIRQDGWGVDRNFGFTIALRDKLVRWFDFKTKRTGEDSITDDDVLDLVTASYMLRRQPLQVGTPVVLHVYDYAYSPLPVEVLRREPVRLPGGREMGTLVVHPQFQQDGMFRKTSDMLVWLSDDENRVPLKIEMETGIPLVGRVTAILVHAQSEPGVPDPPR